MKTTTAATKKSHIFGKIMKTVKKFKIAWRKVAQNQQSEKARRTRIKLLKSRVKVEIRKLRSTIIVITFRVFVCRVT